MITVWTFECFCGLFPPARGHGLLYTGFPLADVDVHAIRIARNSIARLQTDYTATMKRIEQLVFAHFHNPSPKPLPASAPATSASASTASSASTAAPSVRDRDFKHSALPSTAPANSAVGSASAGASASAAAPPPPGTGAGAGPGSAAAHASSAPASASSASASASGASAVPQIAALSSAGLWRALHCRLCLSSAHECCLVRCPASRCILCCEQCLGEQPRHHRRYHRPLTSLRRSSALHLPHLWLLPSFSLSGLKTGDRILSFGSINKQNNAQDKTALVTRCTAPQLMPRLRW
jgi:hypothetical protein